MPWGILLGEFIVLFITSRFLFKSIFAILYFVFHSQKVAIFLLSLFFLPGVFVHEMAHLIVAELLQVKTHGIEFMPELSGNTLKMGSVKVEQSDILRRLLIGIAPFIVGSTILIVSLFILGNIYSYSQAFSSVTSFVVTILIGIVIFVIANTMFSSKKDVEGLVETLVVSLILCGAVYFIGLRPDVWIASLLMQPKALEAAIKIGWLLSIPVGINVFVVLVSLPLLKKLRLI